MYSRVGVTAITCHISNDPDAFGYSIVQPGVPRHSVAARLTDNRSDGRCARSCATKIEPICSADMPTFDPETTLSVSVFAGLRHRPSGVTVGEFSDIGSRVQSFGTVMTFGGAGAAAAGDGEAVDVAGGIGAAGSGEGVGEGVAGAWATSAEMRKTCVRIITPPFRLPSFQGRPFVPAPGSLGRHSGDREWLERAHRLADQAANLIDQRAIVRDSLYKGRIGVALLIAQLEQPELSCMPLFDGDPALQ